MSVTIAATSLVVAGVILAGLLDGWPGAPVPLGFSYLGVVLLLLGRAGTIPAAVCAVTAGGVVLVLVPGDVEALLHGVRRGPSSIVAHLPGWFASRFPLRWFDLSTAAVALVGALDLATARPVLGGGADLVVDVLTFGGLLCCLVARAGRAACGLLFLALAAGVLIQSVGQAPSRVETLLASGIQIGLALVLAHFRFIEDDRTTDGSVAQKRLVEPDVQSSAVPSDEAGPP